MQTSNSIKSIFNFDILSGVTPGYFDCYFLNGRNGDLDLVDYFTSDPDFNSCYLGIQLYEETPTKIDLWFSNASSGRSLETNHVKLTFEVSLNGKLAYTDGLIVFLIGKTTLQLCVMEKPYSPIGIGPLRFRGRCQTNVGGFKNGYTSRCDTRFLQS